MKRGKEKKGTDFFPIYSMLRFEVRVGIGKKF